MVCETVNSRWAVFIVADGLPNAQKIAPDDDQLSKARRDSLIYSLANMDRDA